jgi:hypothetical protein
MTSNGTTTDMAGICQVVSKKNSKPIVDNGTASLSFWLYNPLSTSISGVRAGILEWRNSAAPVNDPVATWNAQNTDPTLTANWFYANTPWAGEQAQDAAWVQVKIENVTINSATENLGVFIWTDDDSFSSGDAIYVTGVQLEPGPVATTFLTPLWETDWLRCSAYFQKTFDYADAPATGINSGGVLCGPTNGIGAYGLTWALRVPMQERGVGNQPSLTYYSPVSANNTAYCLNKPGDHAGGSPSAIYNGLSESSPSVALAETATSVPDADDVVVIHATVEAEY